MSIENAPPMSETILSIPRKTADGTTETVELVVRVIPQTQIRIFSHYHDISTNTKFARKFRDRESGKQKFLMQKKLSVTVAEKGQDMPLPETLRTSALADIRWFLLEFCDKETCYKLEQGIPVTEVFSEYVVESEEEEDDQDTLETP